MQKNTGQHSCYSNNLRSLIIRVDTEVKVQRTRMLATIIVRANVPLVLASLCQRSSGHVPKSETSPCRLVEGLEGVVNGRCRSLLLAEHAGGVEGSGGGGLGEQPGVGAELWEGESLLGVYRKKA